MVIDDDDDDDVQMMMQSFTESLSPGAGVVANASKDGHESKDLQTRQTRHHNAVSWYHFQVHTHTVCNEWCGGVVAERKSHEALKLARGKKKSTMRISEKNYTICDSTLSILYLSYTFLPHPTPLRATPTLSTLPPTVHRDFRFLLEHT